MSLQNYLNTPMGILYSEMGAFFSFSSEQFNKKKVENTIYVSLGAGLLVPKCNVKSFIEEFDKIKDAAIKQDIEDNGIDAIILRELSNYECFYTGEIEDCVEALKCYSITETQIYTVFNFHRE
ncbi:DUF7659 family protein [Pseudoalteromonas sp. GutCa3]|uniref:DUF7659 family protein n=1 Tax=Pseudoalteromonas sp. GutCa3 TaxID=888433 RepID=UPI000C3207E2|nr:hypothetical protein [Pseudoalteromonas sp. GutCa3]PKG68659.1 hypothetical protein CXF64_20265 [Pseudoalteromonas sp. GutCa3]